MGSHLAGREADGSGTSAEALYMLAERGASRFSPGAWRLAVHQAVVAGLQMGPRHRERDDRVVLGAASQAEGIHAEHTAAFTPR